MSWKAILLVPVEVEIEYARDITTARHGADNLLKQYKPVPCAEANGGVIAPKIAVLVGPSTDVEAWAEKRKAALAARLAASSPPIGGGDGPPAA